MTTTAAKSAGAKGATPKETSASKSGVKPAAKPAVKAATAKVKETASRTARRAPATAQESSNVLVELRGLAKELKKAARDLNKKTATGRPTEVSAILGTVERMTADAANKSLAEAEQAKLLVSATLDTLSRDWSRQDIEAHLKLVAGHLTNIIVAQEFQDLAGQSLRKAMKALVGAIIYIEGGGPTEEKRLSQIEVDNLLNNLMP